jgi:hypothetical protein
VSAQRRRAAVFAAMGLTLVAVLFSCRNFSEVYDDYCVAFGGCDGGTVVQCAAGKKLGGESCTQPVECCSDRCVFSPPGTSTGTCETPGASGACVEVGQSCLASTPGATPPMCCAGKTCSNGICVLVGGNDAGLAQGTPCTLNSQCESGFCSDGVCCNSRCGGPCDNCAEPALLGRCIVAVDNAEGSPSCAPYRCNGVTAACPQTCAANPDCNGPTCLGGSFTCGSQLPLGASCGSPGECQSNNCVDGVCCNEPCNGACAACNTPGAEGVCHPQPQGTMPSALTCGYVCNGDTKNCATSCAQDFDCVDFNDYCSGGACVAKLGVGQGCTRATMCGTGYCSEGFCCNSSCDLPCDTCSASGTVGNCVYRNSGTQGIPACPGAQTCSGGSGNCTSLCGNDGDCGFDFFCGADSQCRPKKDYGKECVGDNECKRGFCAQGICCSEPCGQSCQTCSTGLCSYADAGAFGSPSCAYSYCDGANPGCPCTKLEDCASDEFCQLAGTSTGTCVKNTP